jgi:hypothetical protein
MEYPTLNVKQKSRQMLDAFLGYNHNLRIGDEEFYDMMNMTSDYYPVLAPRKRRGVYKENLHVNGLIGKDQLYYVDGSAFVIGDERIEMGLSDGPKQLISMGAYVVIMPDKKWINPQCRYDNGGFNEADGSGCIDEEHTINAGIENEDEREQIEISLCTLAGEKYDVNWGSEPTEEDGKVWIDNTTGKPTVKKYSKAQNMWVSVPTTYVKMKAIGIGHNLQQYDGVEITGITAQPWYDLNGFHTIWGCNENEIIINGIPNTNSEQEASEALRDQITISRKMPIMDFVIESNNRLWGCRYGLNNKGDMVNEIYASKLGDFKNWNSFMNLSTDSYAVSCGTDGPFTGAITHLGYPLFFKENCVHKVYGDYPANFRIQNTTCRGVQKGSDKSLAIVNENVFYKSRNGVCGYDGSLPVEVSSALGEVYYSDAVACAHGNKYYIDMKATDGTYHLFVFDTAKGLWHKEDNIHVDSFCSFGGELYAVEHGENRIVTMLGSGTNIGEQVSWMVESGIVGMSMPDMKYISRLLIRMALEIGAKVEISIQYDSMGDWERVCNMTATSLRSFAVPIRPRRCDHFRIRIEGSGHGKIYSITKTIEQGSDVS